MSRQIARRYRIVKYRFASFKVGPARCSIQWWNFGYTTRSSDDNCIHNTSGVFVVIINDINWFCFAKLDFLHALISGYHEARRALELPEILRTPICASGVEFGALGRTINHFRLFAHSESDTRVCVTLVVRVLEIARLAFRNAVQRANYSVWRITTPSPSPGAMSA